MTPALRGRGCGGGRGPRDVAECWLAVCGLGRGRVVSQRARAALSLGASDTTGERKAHGINCGAQWRPSRAVVSEAKRQRPESSEHNSPAGAGGALVGGQEKPGRADLFELGLFTGVEEDHG